MNVFITGATGFVGRNLLFWLLEHQPDVRLTALTRDVGKAQALCGDPRVHWVAGDLNEPATYRDQVRQAELVFHAGALVKLRNGPEFYPQNVEATRHLLEAAQQAAQLQRFVFVGSIAAYDRLWNSGGHVIVNGPLTEASLPHPRTDYGRSKREAQDLVERSGLPYAVAVPPYIYGPYPRQNSSMDRLIHDVAKGLPYTRLPFSGRVSEIYSEDLAEVLWLLGTHPRAKNEVFFTANPEPITATQAFAEVCKALDQPYESRPLSDAQRTRLQSFLYAREPENPMLRVLFEDYFWCSAEKLFRQLDYTPRYGFAEGVARTVAWYRAQGLLS